MTQTQRAIVIQGPGIAKLVTDRPIPKLRNGHLLVRTVAVGLNPSDWKHIEYLVDQTGPLVGCDYAGIVEDVGLNLAKSFEKGDRVCGVAHGSNVMNHDDGAFAEHIIVNAQLQIKIPDRVSFEQAATLGIGITTIGQALYQSLRLPMPPRALKTPQEFILIYGGSTATGVLGVQFAKLSGYRVVATCSDATADYVKSNGAEATFDYRDPNCADKIRSYTLDGLKLVFDTIATPSSSQICARSMASSAGGQYHSLLPVELPRSDVTKSFKIAYTAFGQDFFFGKDKLDASQDDLEFAALFWETARLLLETGQLRTHQVRVGNGLQGVLDGLQALKNGEISGQKLVYKL